MLSNWGKQKGRLKNKKKKVWWEDGWVQPMKADENSVGGYEAATEELWISYSWH